MTVVIITVRLIPEVDADWFAAHYANLIRETGRDVGDVREVTYEIREASVLPQWCSVCKRYHEVVGERTDAGLITRACPLIPTSDPIYYGSPIYTGDRGARGE